MHEFSVARSLLQQVEAVARKHGAGSVQRVHLRIGARAGIETDLLESAFGLVRPRTVCAEAELRMKVTPARWECPLCATEIEDGAVLRCRDCELPAKMVSGDEILLERLEMEVS